MFSYNTCLDTKKCFSNNIDREGWTNKSRNNAHYREGWVNEGSDCINLFGEKFCLFVFVALRPKSTAMVIAGRSVHLTTLFSWANLNKQLTSNRAHTFACN